MGFAGNVASSDTVNASVRGALAQKSGSSDPAASDFQVCVRWLDYFLCGTYGCELENHWPGREGSSQGLGGVAGGLRAHTAGDLVLGGLATASKTGRTERSKKNSG